MADPRFFAQAGPFTLAALADIAQATARSEGDSGRLFSDVGTLEEAGPSHVTFLDNRRYLSAFSTTKAGACLVHPDHAARAPAGLALLLTTEPYRAYARVAAAFHPDPLPASGIHARAIVDPSANLGEGVVVDAGAVIGARAEIGARVWIGPNVVVGEAVAIGEDSRIGAGASVTHAIIGKRVRIYAGARIGQDGFGFAMGAGGHLKVPQLGRVLIGDDVEIGANTTIDRGSASDTVVGSGTLIDNLVQIGHNVRIGRGCVIVALAGISGSTRFDDFVVVGGQAGFAGHLRIGTGVRVSAQAGVHRDVPAGTEVAGTPAIPFREFKRLVAMWRLQALQSIKGRKPHGDDADQ